MASIMPLHALLVALLAVAFPFTVAGKACPPGYNYSSTACTKCYAGTYNPVVNSTCIPCPAGSYANVTGATSCTACPKDSITIDGFGFNRCFACPPGSLGPTDDKKKCKCPLSQIWIPGYGMIGSCTPCYKGYYCPAGARPQRCPGGTYNPKEGATSPKACIKCPKDTYAPEGSDQCSKCPSGSKGPTADQSTCICPKNTWKRPVPDLACLRCPAGAKPTADQSLCACPAGRYFQATWMECINCEPGFYCPEGTTDAPKLCPAGTYSPSIGATSVKTCKQCPKGTAAWSGAGSCDKCPKGAEGTPAGSEDCVCPAGTCTYPGAKVCSAKYCL